MKTQWVQALYLSVEPQGPSNGQPEEALNPLGGAALCLNFFPFLSVRQAQASVWISVVWILLLFLLFFCFFSPLFFFLSSPCPLFLLLLFCSVLTS